MQKSDFYFDLPEELIAQAPAAGGRDACKLLVMDRTNGALTDTTFRHIGEWLRPGDLLVFNDSKVFPGRVVGSKESGGRVELLLLRHIEDTATGHSNWETMLKTRNALPGTQCRFSDTLSGVLIERMTENTWQIELDAMHAEVLNELQTIGHIPIPPYIKESPLSEEQLRDEYQTVFANDTAVGSAAAPTAGLHFTHTLLDQLQSAGVETTSVTLHVGLGTFAPIRVDNLAEHTMHSEFAIVSEKAALAINTALQEGRRVIAVGTTAVRTLESFVGTKNGHAVLEAGSKWTNIFITPGYQFGIVSGLITNFHLPESTLLMLVSAFIASCPEHSKHPDTGRELLLAAYTHAIEQQYRFYSFGDAMLIV